MDIYLSQAQKLLQKPTRTKEKLKTTEKLSGNDCKIPLRLGTKLTLSKWYFVGKAKDVESSHCPSNPILDWKMWMLNKNNDDDDDDDDDDD